MNKKISQCSIYLIYAGATAFFFSLIFTVSQVYYIEMLELRTFSGMTCIRSEETI